MKNKAFTLSEFLIAIGIIGIIAIITLPGVYNNMMAKNRVASLQRVYLLMSNAVKIMMNNSHASNIGKTYLYKTESDSVEDTAGTFIRANFKLAQDCGKSMTPCFAASYKTFDNSKNVTFPSSDDMYCVLLPSRASMCLIPPQNSTPGITIVDVNGPVKPNIAGKDLFVFYVYNDGYVGDRDDDSDSCASHDYGVGCFTKLVESNWVMDY